jgi:hypothetical protein
MFNRILASQLFSNNVRNGTKGRKIPLYRMHEELHGQGKGMKSAVDGPRRERAGKEFFRLPCKKNGGVLHLN